MPHLSISLLGTPQVSLDQVSIKFPTSRAIPILGYLAINQYPQTRETLANLLWTDSNQNQALAALRTTLWRLKRIGLEDWISWNRREISLANFENLDVDVANFQAQLDHCSVHGHPLSSICTYCTPLLTEAVTLYRGEFMKGFNISRAPAFDDWRMQQSATYETMYLDALERLVKCHRTFGDFNLAIHYSRLWINADRLNENSHIQLLQLYSITGQRTAAISAYKHYRDTLFHELGLLPTEEIQSIYRQIVSGRTVPVAKPKLTTPVILIAEIEKSSLFWSHAGDKKAQLLNTYMNIIRDTARRFGGNILQKAEDNVTVLFESGQPLHCAVTLHLMLKRAGWGEIGPPSVRMVIYSTIIDDENASNFALLTNAASALLSISWGGQIVFTEKTLRHLDLPSGATVKDLGFHYINDKEGSVHIFELQHPHLPKTEHPPLHSAGQQLNNLPIFEPPFIGREHELEKLQQLVLDPSNRLISLIGPGGVGKTRLAIEFANRAAEQFPHGIFFISLASIEDPKFIPILVAEALKFNFYGPYDQNEQLSKYLNSLNALLIIDNFEHMRQGGANFLASLLSNTHNLKILATSRERMSLIAETVMEVGGFPVPDRDSDAHAADFTSIKLFLQNAQKTFPRFSAQKNLESIIRICQIVDGVPLGILLASSWVRVFSCSEIATEINKNIDFLTSSASDLDPRHRSLSAVFDSSWKLLSEEERRVTRRLAIFHSSFSVVAAQEICNASPLVLSLLTDKSLLYHQQDGRYYMLTTFNHYAASKLAEVEAESVETQEKFCEFFAEYCARKQSELISQKQQVALSEMASEIEHIRIAWSMMVDTNRWDLLIKFKDSLLGYHAILGNFYHGEELFNLALAKLNALNLPEQNLIRAYMLQYSAWMQFRTGFTSESLPKMKECLEFFRSRNAIQDVAMTQYYMAEIHLADGNLLEAKAAIEQAISLLHDDSLPGSNYQTSLIAHFQDTLGRIYIGLGDYDQAQKYLTTSLEVNKKIGTIFSIIFPLMGLARLASLQGEFLQARDLYDHALTEAVNLSDHRNILLIHNNLSDIYETIGNVPESHRHLLTALELCKETGDRRLAAVIMNNQAYQQLRYDHNPSGSIQTYLECLELFSELGDLRGIAYSSYDISRAYLEAGLFDEAWNSCLRCLNTSLDLDNTPMVLHSLHGFANYYAGVGLDEHALRLCYQIIPHPEIGSDTRKRAIVSSAVIEARLSADLIRGIRSTIEPADLNDIIDQVLSDKPHFP